MEHTSVWEHFKEQADDAVTHIREQLQQLMKDARKLDLDLERREDDRRFTELLKSDWVSASKDVAQVMARVNADWLATGEQVAELMAKADAGDAAAQRQLADVLRQREELACERSAFDTRQTSVNTTQEQGRKPFQGVRDMEERRGAREEFFKLAATDAKSASAALQKYIQTLEGSLSQLAVKAKDAESAQQYEAAAAFEEKAKAIADALSDLRGMNGQIQERSFVTGEFNARAMAAMMRGGGMEKEKVQRDQLQTMQDMVSRLDKLIAKTNPPNIYAVE